MRSDLAPLYPSFVNEALTYIQQQRSWLVMKANGIFRMANGASAVNLDVDEDGLVTRFKELTLGKSPVHLRGNDLVLTPCEVWPREKILRRQARLISNSLLYSVYSHPNTTRRVSIPVWVQWTRNPASMESVPSLQILFKATSDLPFDITYYGFLPDLEVDDDSNFFTDRLGEMVLAKAKALAFAAINDPATADFEKLYEAKFAAAAAQDAYQAVAGLELRM